MLQQNVKTFNFILKMKIKDLVMILCIRDLEFYSWFKELYYSIILQETNTEFQLHKRTKYCIIMVV